MIDTNTAWFRRGLRDGIPIALGYFAVAFTLGFAAKNAGFSAFQAMIESFTNNASAGEYAVFSLAAAGAGYWEVAVMTLVTNARYLLMSCSLSQKLSPDTSLVHRMLVAFDVTDEIFGISIAVPGRLNPFYSYGAMSLAITGWGIGTFLGGAVGSVLPLRLASALSVGLYGMFLAVIVPPARENRVILGTVLLSFAVSFVSEHWALLSGVSSGTRTIILTVALALGAAVLFPIKDDEEGAAQP
ncbi:MAG: AzlC family ABC transporter permease [Oscillospiraceae bacterium]|nr:AzlC family ABC transporter permease [Oscillospiraceae bacterium]